MTNKEIERLKELDAKASKCEHFTSEEIQERNDLEFKRNKQNVYMRLSGYDKYYYAHQCWDFTQHILKGGFNQYTSKDIVSVSINNNQYYGASIKARLLSGGETNFKTFNDKKELLGFIVGYNEAKREG
jgi:hypothetical protein